MTKHTEVRMKAKKGTAKRKNKNRGGRQVVKSLLAPPTAEKESRDRVEAAIDSVMETLRDAKFESRNTADTRARIRLILERDIKKPK